MLNNGTDYLVSVQEFAKMNNLSRQSPYKIFKNTPDILTSVVIKNKTYIPAESICKYRRTKGDVPALVNNSKVLAFFNGKGGVGKSTLAVNLAVKAAIEGMMVLMIDMDMQANITKTFGFTDPKDYDTFLNIAKEEINIEDAIVNIKPTLKFIPANGSLGKLSDIIDFKDGFDQIRKPIERIKDQFDIIIIDCGPSINNINFAVICASDIILSPAFPDAYSEEGLELTCEEIERAKKRGVNPAHKILINKFHMSERASRDYLTKYSTSYREKLCDTIIRTSANLTNAINENQSIFELEPNSPVAADIDSLFRELTGKLNEKDSVQEIQ